MIGQVSHEMSGVTNSPVIEEWTDGITLKMTDGTFEKVSVVIVPIS